MKVIQKIILDQSTSVFPPELADRSQIQQAWQQGLSVSIQAIRTVERTANVKRVQCGAQLRISSPRLDWARLQSNLFATTAISEAGLSRDGSGLVGQIVYSSQPTDDGKQVYVELQGARGLGIAAAFVAFASLPEAPPEHAHASAASQATAAVEQATQGFNATELSADRVSAAPAQVRPHPSFDCSKASTTAEKLICSDPRLAEADARLAASYKAAVAAAPDGGAGAKAAQRAWLSRQRAACADVDCLLLAYEARQAEFGK